MANEPKQKRFGAHIRALREAQEISLRKFAERAQISPTYLSKVERDEFPPPGEEAVRRIADILGEDPDELLALAGKVASDLPGIIQQHPRAMATFLRAASGLPAAEIEKLARRAVGLRKKGPEK
ncbi:MAG TPA: helix-turn-helix transcriptional regulator [Bryobacteraceae bacterium]|nr:helix-turn-helix transcriptional regulator [Bryobacteraceae bacterium]